MKIENQHYRTIWVKENNAKIVQIIDQTKLPHQFVISDLASVDDFIVAIKSMQVRGAPLIGVAAAYGMYIATLQAPKNDFDNYILRAATALQATRPTAINLAWAVKRQLQAINSVTNYDDEVAIALKTANEIADEDINFCRNIGEHGLKIIQKLAAQKPNKVFNILTHCNAGWLATVDYGTATAPIYAAFAAGINLHVWVDETRPRNQGAQLTAWELLQQGVPHHVIADNVGGHLMQHDMVDMVIVGSDRTTRCGDVANKIGTYLKALAATANNVPFYVALPSSTFDWNLCNGVKEIPIEERDATEVKYVQGLADGKVQTVLITPEKSPAINYGFDVTPARYITGLITERGVCQANEQSILQLFPEKKC
jgi:methylthioribose-1-phosphate isomerase